MLFPIPSAGGSKNLLGTNQRSVPTTGCPWPYVGHRAISIVLSTLPPKHLLRQDPRHAKKEGAGFNNRQIAYFRNSYVDSKSQMLRMTNLLMSVAIYICSRSSSSFTNPSLFCSERMRHRRLKTFGWRRVLNWGQEKRKVNGAIDGDRGTRVSARHGFPSAS